MWNILSALLITTIFWLAGPWKPPDSVKPVGSVSIALGSGRNYASLLSSSTRPDSTAGPADARRLGLLSPACCLVL